jgi:hypothetical protein
VSRPSSPLDSRNGGGYQSIYPEGDSLAADIDLRAQIVELLQNRGHYVFHRKAKDRRCGCFNDVIREAKIDCPYCTGTGWLYADQKRKARKMPITDPVVAALLERSTAIGKVAISQFVFFLEHDPDWAPSLRDLILEVTLNEETGEPVKPYNIETTWDIGQVYDARDKHGRVEFWTVWVRRGALGKE